ncbi:MAG: radical SAM protein, partial [Oscillospiraceae bacterium]|nr:radical SAM protein [Oscillospiraceae bacterium]
MHVIRNTRSVCPVCLKNISAQLIKEDNCVKMQKTCPEHGSFSAIVWRGKTDFESWRGNVPMLGESDGNYCPQNCGICSEHQQGSCCVLLEVTRRCNLKCKFCFADEAQPELTMDELKRAVDKIFSRGKPLVQLSGGEPTLRDDLPELIAYIRSSGAQYVQLNSNGLRLAEDEGYVKALADAGLSFVFMQFDGISDDVYMALRGKELFETKRRAIETCGKYGLGVTLVPTVVRGVNEHQLGDIIRFGAELSPVVRGAHFQPVSYFGRYPTQPDDDERYTLDELIEALGTQAGISEENIAPSRCDHPGCGLHASFAVMPDRSLMPLTVRRNTDSVSTAGQNREYIGSRWKRSIQAENSGTA